MKNSLKQLFRTPVRALLFFLLMAAATALLAFGSVLYAQSSQRIAEVEGSFTTLGMIRQVPAKTVTEVQPTGPCGWGGGVRWEDIWDDIEGVDVLNFEGAEYLTPPENRPYYIANAPALTHVAQNQVLTQIHVAQAVALEDSDPDTGAAKMQVEKVLTTYDDGYTMLYDKSSVMKEGKVFLLCQCQSDRENRTALEKGKQYVFSCEGFSCSMPQHSKELSEHQLDTREYVAWSNPYCQQFDKNGRELPSTYFSSNSKSDRIDEITEDFWEPGGYGEKWEYWVDYQEKGDHWFTVAPVNDLQLLPAFQNHKAYLSKGREITEEEFSSGAAVCMLPDAVLDSADLQIGDKIPLSMLCSVYGAPEDEVGFPMWFRLSPFNAQGKLYEPFWEAEYEIVGTYSLTNQTAALSKGEIANDMLVIPAASVLASDENNIAYFSTLKPAQATFLLPNGSVDSFEAALQKALPDLEGLEIIYNDNGYEEIMGSLRSAWITSVLLFAVGLLAAVAILLLLLYFFIVKQKKRTAIERSLGMTKRQCRVSLLAGILVLTVLSTTIGSLSAALLLKQVDITSRSDPGYTVSAEESGNAAPQEQEMGEPAEEGQDTAEPAAVADSEQFSTKFSLWASEANRVEYTARDVETPVSLLFLIPAAFLLLVFVLSLLLVNRNLKIEPIYLLSGKMEN